MAAVDQRELERRFQLATDVALASTRQNMLVLAEQKNQQIIQQYHPNSYVRLIDGVVTTVEVGYRLYQVAKLAKNIADQRASTIVYRYSYADDVVQYSLQILRENSPVGAGRDPHPGLYRDSHMVFIDGRAVKDAKDWRPGQTIHISNPEPYSRKIESGSMKMSVPGHVYEFAVPRINARFGNRFSIKLVFMPVTFGNNQAWANHTAQQRTGRKLSPKARADWLVRQPTLEIKGL